MDEVDNDENETATATARTIRVTATVDVDGVRARLLAVLDVCAGYGAIDPDAPGWNLASDALLAIDGLRQEVERLRGELKSAEADADACFRDSVAAWDREAAQP